MHASEHADDAPAPPVTGPQLTTILGDYDRFYATELNTSQQRAAEIAPGFDTSDTIQKSGAYYIAERQEVVAQPFRSYVTHGAARDFRDLAHRRLILKRQAYLANMHEAHQAWPAVAAAPSAKPINSNDIARHLIDNEDFYTDEQTKLKAVADTMSLPEYLRYMSAFQDFKIRARGTL